jgi:hypothetical protein
MKRPNWNRYERKASCPSTRHEGAWGERRYSSYSFSTSELDGGEWSASRPGERTPGTIVQETGWTPEPVWTQRLEEKSFRFCRGSNLDRPVFQPVARHYTDWATRLTMRGKGLGVFKVLSPNSSWIKRENSRSSSGIRTGNHLNMNQTRYHCAKSTLEDGIWLSLFNEVTYTSRVTLSLCRQTMCWCNHWCRYVKQIV